MEKSVIFLVEDNKADEELTVRALKKSRIRNEILVARDGQEALDLLFGPQAESVFPPDGVPEMIILDVDLPRVDGLTILKKIREHSKTKMVPVMILTGSKEDQTRTDSFLNGANCFILKPLDCAHFAEAVEKISSFWLVGDKSPR